MCTHTTFLSAHAKNHDRLCQICKIFLYLANTDRMQRGFKIIICLLPTFSKEQSGHQTTTLTTCVVARHKLRYFFVNQPCTTITCIYFSGYSRLDWCMRLFPYVSLLWWALACVFQFLASTISAVVLSSAYAHMMHRRICTNVCLNLTWSNAGSLWEPWEASQSSSIWQKECGQRDRSQARNANSTRRVQIFSN